MPQLYVILANDSYTPNRTLEFSAYTTGGARKNDLAGNAKISKGGNASFIQFPISGVTQANPGVVNAPSCDTALHTDDIVLIASVVGMAQLNGSARVGTVTANHFTLLNLDGTSMDTTGFGAYTSGGTVDLIQRQSTNTVVHVGDGVYSLVLGRPGDLGVWDTGECDMLGRGKVFIRAGSMTDIEVEYEIVAYDPHAAGSTPGDISTATMAALDAATTEPTAPPTATAGYLTLLRWALTFFRNKMTNDGSSEKLYADNGTSVIGTRAVSDASGTTTKDKVS